MPSAKIVPVSTYCVGYYDAEAKPSSFPQARHLRAPLSARLGNMNRDWPKFDEDNDATEILIWRSL